MALSPRESQRQSDSLPDAAQLPYVYAAARSITGTPQ